MGLVFSFLFVIVYLLVFGYSWVKHRLCSGNDIDAVKTIFGIFLIMFVGIGGFWLAVFGIPEFIGNIALWISGSNWWYTFTTVFLCITNSIALAIAYVYFRIIGSVSENTKKYILTMCRSEKMPDPTQEQLDAFRRDLFSQCSYTKIEQQCLENMRDVDKSLPEEHIRRIINREFHFMQAAWIYFNHCDIDLKRTKKKYFSDMSVDRKYFLIPGWTRYDYRMLVQSSKE